MGPCQAGEAVERHVLSSVVLSVAGSLLPPVVPCMRVRLCASTAGTLPQIQWALVDDHHQHTAASRAHLRVLVSLAQGISMGGLAKVSNLCRDQSSNEMSAKQLAALTSGHIMPFPSPENTVGGDAYDCGEWHRGCSSWCSGQPGLAAEAVRLLLTQLA